MHRGTGGGNSEDSSRKCLSLTQDLVFLDAIRCFIHVSPGRLLLQELLNDTDFCEGAQTTPTALVPYPVQGYLCNNLSRPRPRPPCRWTMDPWKIDLV